MSAQDMVDPKLSQWLLENLKSYPNPENITLELLETEGIDNYAKMKLYINQYRTLGVKVFIDDFGVGYSNISHFLKLNVDGIKLDGSLVERICDDEDVHLFINYIIQFANAVGIDVVAEYIENEEILNAVRNMGVHMVQGYYFSAPTPEIVTVCYKIEVDGHVDQKEQTTAKATITCKLPITVSQLPASI